MKIAVYAGSIRPGGGLAVLRQVLRALVNNVDFEVVVYLGSTDTLKGIEDLISAYPNLIKRPFLMNRSVMVRYLFSKLGFIVGREFDWVLSFNHYLPTRCNALVYHINLLSFRAAAKDSLADKLRRIDAKLACKHASVNVFESEYLLQEAQTQMEGRVVGPEVLYVGVNPEFLRHVEHSAMDKGRASADVLLVSSVQPHKDNLTCLLALEMLIRERPEVPWRLVVCGGQSVDQWAGLIEEASKLGVGSQVLVKGRLVPAELSQLMSACLCTISASRVESFCMVALESMASGCPAVVTDATSMPESVGDAAVIVPAGSAQRFADAIIGYYDDHSLREEHIRKGRARAESYGVKQFDTGLAKLIRGSVFAGSRV